MCSKINELTVYAVDQSPDIILLTETWCNANILDAALSIPGYQLETDLRMDRRDTTNGLGGGLLVYTRLGLKILLCDKFKENLFNQFCSFKVLTKGDPLKIILVYRPPGAGQNNTEALCELMRNLDRQTLIIGDVNLPDIDWLDLTSSARGRPVLTTALEEGLDQLVHFATHTKGNTLDLVLTNCPDKIISINDGGRVGKSDHCILNIEVKVKTVRRIVKTTRSNWTKADIVGLKRFLSEINWHQEMASSSVERLWATFKRILESAMEQFVPKSTVRAPDAPRWLTREIVRLVRRKKRAWKLTQTHGTQDNINNYKKLEKEVTVKVRSAKRGMEKKLAYSGENNQKTFANYIKSKTKAHTGIGPLKDSDGRLVTDEKEMSEKLNKFFASVFSRENTSNIPTRDLETNAKLENVIFTESTIRKQITKLKSNSAPGPDKISAHLLQHAREELLLPLKIIFNLSLKSGTVPQDWRHATVTPIFKKGTKGDPANYRPVSLTSIPCKIFESILKDKIMQHLMSNNLINESQHGFMPGKSCSTNLVIFLDKLTEIVDRGKAADIFYLDFAKAFDKVPKARLIQKLRTKGISGNILNWIENWLTDRTQSVRVGNASSSNCDVKSGVPQGSVLGPPLFTIFIDDIDDSATLIDLLMKFADDTKGLQEIGGEDDRRKLQMTLDRLTNWAEEWGMKFNIEKCKIMHVGRNNPHFDYYMDGIKLKTVEEEKDIGVTIHKSLKPSAHCKRVADTANAVLRQLTKNFHFRDRHVFRKLYIQYVRPHVEFASPAWSPWNEADKNVIENVQKRAVSMISGLTGTTYEAKCQELGLDTLEERRRKQDLVQAYKILSGKDNVRPELLFTKVGGQPERLTGFTTDPLNLTVNRSRLEVRKNSYATRVAEDWNRLSNNTKSSRSVGIFKNAIANKSVPGSTVGGQRR